MKQKKEIVNKFTEGNIPRQLFTFMLPFMASNAFQVIYSAVDMIIVGRYVGSAGLSAVAQCSQILNLCTMIVTGLCTGGQVVISQLIGADLRQELTHAIGTLFSFVLLIGVGMSFVILLFHGTFLAVLNMPPEAMDMGKSYLRICGVGLIFSVGYNMMSSVLRSMGDSRHPFYFITLASVLNLILDLLFTGYMGLGVAGAAAATMLGQAVSCLFALRFLYIHRELFYFDFKPASFRIKKIYFKTMAAQGIPVALSSSTVYFSQFYVQSLINSAGVIASATFGVGIKIDDICNKVSVGIRYAATPMVGQNWAAKNIKRVKSVFNWALIYGIVMHLAFMAVYYKFGVMAFGLFTTDSEVLALAPVFIRSIIITFIPMALMRGTNALIQGIGNAKLSMFLALMDGVICRAGLSYFFGVVCGMGFSGLVLGYGLAPFGSVIPGSIYILSGRWKKRASIVEKIQGKSEK